MLPKKLFFAFWVTLVCYLNGSALAGQSPENSFIELAPGEFTEDQTFINWRNMAPGIDILEFKLQKYPAEDLLQKIKISAILHETQDAQANFIIVRSEPKKCGYSLHMTSEDGHRQTMLKRVQNHKLYAAINAGMFLPDNLKNTGFMRNATHVNNGRIASNFGVFFLAGPRKAGLPQAIILEKSDMGDKLTEKIADYDIVIQNYRLISSTGKILWPDSPETYSISALSADKAGNILFIFCAVPLSAADFSRVLLALPLGINLTMYLEGGSQAGLITVEGVENTRQKTGYRIWGGLHRAFAGFTAFEHLALPNVLGVFSNLN
ncbi:MAG: phosphodiester glycosidase family protein [Deltaproteobacteria bacterium]|jgi:uncharacterized protein YigE (DUF2233 family)|nr:phosphodiester glycosidase family protein [Deltaproteobacteria bacterium]